MRRLGLRGRLSAVVTVGAALTLGVLTLGFNLVLRSSLDHDANQALAARAGATLGTIEVDRGRVRRSEAPDGGIADALVWIYSGGGAVEAPRAAPELKAQARRLATGPRAYAEDAQSDVRLLGEPIVRDGRQVGTVVVGISLEPYERSASQALIVSALFALVIFALIVIATRLVIGASLRPVARMTQEATDWSVNDLDHRFHAGEPHDELTGLASTFDSMLDGLAASLRHERRFSAEVSHELRTPLAAVLAEAELALRRHREPSEYRAALSAIVNRATQLQRTVETLLAAERAGHGRPGTADAAAVARSARDSGAALAADLGIELRVVTDNGPLRIGMDADAAERVLAPLIENACRYGHSWAEVRVRRENEHVDYVVSDDGPGVEPDETDGIFEPGVRGEAGIAADLGGNGGSSGAGLGLALSRRLARALDGDVRYAAERRAFVFQAPRG
jgi:signal transduction histidine kinase